MGRGIFVFAALFCSIAFPAIQWECDEHDWVGSPGLDDGIFRSTLSANCRILGSRPEALQGLQLAILQTIREKSVIHHGPSNIRSEGLNGISVEVTNTVEDSGTPVKIREEALILTDYKERLIYRTRSKGVEASGMASYLRKVAFNTELHWNKEHVRFDVAMKNTVHVERPWYALGPLFVMIAKGISKSKFSKARAQLLDYLTLNLSISATAPQ